MDHKALSVLPPTPAFNLATFDLRFYVGRDTLKVKAVDKATGAGFTVAYLCPTVGGDPIKSGLARDFAAMAVASSPMLAALEAVASDQDSMTLLKDGVANQVRAAIAQARREVPTIGDLSPEIEAQLKG